MTAHAIYNGALKANAFSFHAAIDLSLSGNKFSSHARARWHIGEMFRAFERIFYFLKFLVRGKNRSLSTSCLPFALLSDLHWRPEQGGAPPRMPFRLAVRSLGQRFF